jgi:hypothetical protein
MRTTIITFFLILLSLASQAQTEKKILLSIPDSAYFEYFANELDTTIPLYYSGEVEINVGILPDSLNNFEAIFISGRRYDEESDSIVRIQANRISSYLENGGNVFFDVSFIDNMAEAIEFSENNITDSFPQFSLMTGISSLYHVYVFKSRIKEIKGVDSTFTQGFKIINNDNSLIDPLDYIFGIQGEILRVLTALASPQYTMAWAYSKEDHKSVVHWDISDDHFPRFIGLVLCNYFNLCTPLQVGNYIPTASFELTNPTYIRDRNELLFSYESPSVTKLDVSVYNILGERVYYSYDNDAGSTNGEMRIRLNGRLASGGYFLVVKTSDGVARKPFFVIN